MAKDIIIQEDNYTGTINERYQQAGQEIDAIVTEYIKIVTDLANSGIDGETAEKLKGFAEEAGQLLGNMMEPAVTECAGKQTNFVSDIEAEDQ